MDLTGTAWTVEQLAGEPVPARVRLGATFGADGTVSGPAGVNSYRAWWTVVDDVLTVGPLLMTRMAGPPERMELEQRWVALLGAPLSLRREGARLLLGVDTVLVPSVELQG